jgi:hypothetical protein
MLSGAVSQKHSWHACGVQLDFNSVRHAVRPLRLTVHMRVGCPATHPTSPRSDLVVDVDCSEQECSVDCALSSGTVCVVSSVRSVLYTHEELLALSFSCVTSYKPQIKAHTSYNDPLSSEG